MLSFYAAISMAMIFVDARFHTLELLRQGISLFTHPLQQIAQAPVDFFQNGSHYFSSITRFQEENNRLKHAQIGQAAALLRMEQLESENERLRELQGMVVLSGYASELYVDELPGWISHNTAARISSGRGTALRTEVVWLNPACADALASAAGGLFSEAVA